MSSTYNPRPASFLKRLPRTLLTLSALIVFCGMGVAGEIVVYSQTWRGTTPGSYERKHNGKGYVLIDFQNQAVTRISTNAGGISKTFRIENFVTNVFVEFYDPIKAKDNLVIQSSRRSTSTSDVWERVLFFKGKQALLQIGPSQSKQIPKLLTGLRRMTRSYFIGSGVEEDSFSARFSAAMTQDANANSRTLAEQVELLAGSLEEAGFRRSGIE